MKAKPKLTPVRRTPQLARGELRVAVLLDAATAVIGEVGYEAATMTAIADRAGSSIGALYQYYRDKTAIADALCARFGEELIDALEAFALRVPQLDAPATIDGLVEILLGFTSGNPAAMLVMLARTERRQEPSYKHRVLLLMAELLRGKAEHLGSKDAFRIAAVSLQVLKSLHALSSDAGPAERKKLEVETANLLAGYLKARVMP